MAPTAGARRSAWRPRRCWRAPRRSPPSTRPRSSPTARRCVRAIVPSIRPSIHCLSNARLCGWLKTTTTTHVLLFQALYCSKIVSYAQGMNLIRAASDPVNITPPPSTPPPPPAVRSRPPASSGPQSHTITHDTRRHLDDTAVRVEGGPGRVRAHLEGRLHHPRRLPRPVRASCVVHMPHQHMTSIITQHIHHQTQKQQTQKKKKKHPRGLRAGRGPEEPPGGPRLRRRAQHQAGT